MSSERAWCDGRAGEVALRRRTSGSIRSGGSAQQHYYQAALLEPSPSPSFQYLAPAPPPAHSPLGRSLRCKARHPPPVLPQTRTPLHLSRSPAFAFACLPMQGSMVTMDFRTDRVRVFYDTETQLVVSPPRIG